MLWTLRRELLQTVSGVTGLPACPLVILTRCKSQAQSRQYAVQMSSIRFLFAASPASRLRRRRDDVRDSGVIHLLVQCRQVFFPYLLDLRRGIAHQRRQLRQFFLLLPAGSGREPIQILKQALHLQRQRIRLPFERRPSVAETLTFADKLLRQSVDLLLKFIRRLLHVLRNFGRVRFSRILLPLLPRCRERDFDSFDCPAVPVGRLRHRVELVDRVMPRRAVRLRNLHARIILHDSLLRRLPASRFDLDGVFTWLNQRAARPKSKALCNGFELLWSWFRR